MNDDFFSSEGRIGRVVFAVRLLLLVLLVLGVTHYAMDYFHHWHHGTYQALGVFIGIIVALFCSLALLMQLLKRLRDLGKPAYLSILLLVPGVNILLLLYAGLAPSKD